MPAPSVSYADRPWLASYPPGVPADVDVPPVPVTRLLDDAAAAHPDRPALAFLGATTTYRQLVRQVDAFAAGLSALGVRRGDRVAVVLPNCPQNVVALFAALRLGAVVVQHNPLSTAYELQHQLADSGATVAVCLDRVVEVLAQVQSQTAVRAVVVTSLADALPPVRRLALRLPLARQRRARARLVAPLPPGAPVRHYAQLLRTPPLPAAQVPALQPDDLALLQYTGGTTGLPRGAMLTHGNLVSDTHLNRVWDTAAVPGREVTLGVLPLFHAYGLTVALLNTVLLGGLLVLLPRFELDEVFDAVERHRPTLLPGVPPIYKALADSHRASSSGLRSVRLCVSGAMRLPPDVQEQFERVTGARLVEGYGMTETSPVTHCNPATDRRRPGTIGLPLPCTRAKVVAPEDPEREVPPGSPGELAIAGPQVFVGYWPDREREGVFTADGAVLTGDIAVMDEDGFFTLVDRKKELVIAGGFNVYPSEVEHVLRGLPGVADVVVVGVPDRYRGETVKAFVVRDGAAAEDLTEQDVVAHCARQLSPYKVPKLVEFRQELPRSAVGKVLRRVLLEQEQTGSAPT